MLQRNTILLAAILLVIVQSAVGACPHVEYASATKLSSVTLRDGQVLNLQAGVTYMYDLETSPNFQAINVRGRLVFDDTKRQDLALKTIMMTVHDGGEVLIGSCDCPFSHKLNITLLDPANRNEDPNLVGTKVIGVLRGGRLVIDGAVRGPTWTTLASTATAGSTSFTLSKPVTWVAGDRIVLTTTDFPPWQTDNVNDNNYGFRHNDESDERTVVSVSADGRTVTVNRALTYTHYSGENHGVETRGEVALLTRNVLVQGDAASDNGEFGGHFMFLEGAFAYLRGVEVTRCGQKGFLGRYPIHYHMMGNTLPGQGVIECSIHYNYQRAITVHATNGLTIKRNVAYKVFGHMYFLEDGNEVKNYFEYNLGVTPLKIPAAKQLPGIRSDHDPSVFWITNPDNAFIGNVAVGSPLHCIWYALPVNPTGPSNTRSIIPRFVPLLKFEHNVAHSCAADGLHVDTGPNQLGVAGGPDPVGVTQYISRDKDGNTHNVNVGAAYVPYEDPSVTTIQDYDRWRVTPQKEVFFDNFVAWKNRNRAVWVRGGRLTFRNSRFADNAIGITFATNGNSLGKFIDSIIVGQTNNYGNVGSWYVENQIYDHIDGSTPPFRSVPKTNRPATIPSGHQLGPFYPIRGYEFYDGPNIIDNLRCYGFIPTQRRNASCISMLRDDQFSIAQSNRALRVYTPDGSNMIYYPDLSHDGDKASVFWDLDGSVTGRPPVTEENFAVVTNNHPFYRTPGCHVPTAGDVYLYGDHYPNPQDFIRSCDSKISCPNHFVGFYSSMSSVTYPASLSGMEGLIRIQREDAPGSPLYVCGGPCNGGTEVVEVMGRASSFFGTLILWRTYYLDFLTSTAPATFNFAIGYGRHTIEKTRGTNNVTFYEVTMAFCYPPGTRVNSVMYNWKTNARAAATLGDIFTNNYSYDWGTRGDGMWYHDQTTNYVWVRMIISHDQMETIDSFGSGCNIQISAAVGSGTSRCTPEFSPTQKPDTIRTLPATGTVAASPPFTPGPAKPSWDDASSCEVTESPCVQSEWSLWGTCEGTCHSTNTVQGSQSRSRETLQEPSANGIPCGPLQEQRSCNLACCTCDVDCVVGLWSAWSACDSSCRGTPSRQREVTVQQSGAGAPCPATTQTSVCAATDAKCQDTSSAISITSVLALALLLACLVA